MAKSSELTAIRAAGVSVKRIVGSVAQVGLILGLIALFMGEVISPFTETKAQNIRAESIQSGVRSSGRGGIWLRDENTFVSVSDVLPDLSLLNVKIFEFDQNNFLRFLSVAEAGYYQDQKWLLQGLKRTMINNASSAADEVDAAYWSTVVNPQILQVFLIQPDQLSLWQLRQYIHHLKSNRQRTDNYELAFWSKLVTPIATIVMLILAVPFVFQHARSGTMGRSLFSGIMIGLGFFILNKAFSYFVPLFAIPPFIGAITPTLLVATISIALIRRIR
jgi:lipopolysaccharide export system permease protein